MESTKDMRKNTVTKDLKKLWLIKNVDPGKVRWRLGISRDYSASQSLEEEWKNYTNYNVLLL